MGNDQWKIFHFTFVIRRFNLGAYCLLLPLFLPEHQVLQEVVVAGEARDAETCEAVAKTPLQNEAANKPERRSSGNAQARCSASLFEHLQCGQRRIPFTDHAM